jgi:hypothetical protein
MQSGYAPRRVTPEDLLDDRDVARHAATYEDPAWTWRI